MKTVSELAVGETGTVTGVGGRGAIRQRLLDMGILPRVRIAVERLAPTGDPVWIRIRGMQLALRRREALAVEIAS